MPPVCRFDDRNHHPRFLNETHEWLRRGHVQPRTIKGTGLRLLGGLKALSKPTWWLSFLVFFFLCLGLIFQAFGLVLNTTASMPIGFWRRLPSSPLAVGQVVLFCPEDTPLMQHALRLGVLQHGRCPGSYRPLLKEIQVVDWSNKTLWVIGHSERSFDSRIFGPIRIGQVIGQYSQGSRLSGTVTIRHD